MSRCHVSAYNHHTRIPTISFSFLFTKQRGVLLVSACKDACQIRNKNFTFMGNLNHKLVFRYSWHNDVSFLNCDVIHKFHEVALSFLDMSSFLWWHTSSPFMQDNLCQHIYIHMRLIYVNMHNNYVEIQHSLNCMLT